MGELLKRISYCLVIVLCAMFCVEYCTNKELKEENNRLQNNQTALTKDIEAYRLKDSSFVAEIEVLSLSKDEFLQVCSKQAKEIKDLKIKISRLQNVTNSTLEHNYNFDTVFFAQKESQKQPIRTDETDSAEKLRCFEYSDSWIKFNGCLNNDYLTKVNIQTYDTITTAVSKEYRKRFLFLRWKPYYKVVLHSKNPYSKITGAESVVFVK